MVIEKNPYYLKWWVALIMMLCVGVILIICISILFVFTPTAEGQTSTNQQLQLKDSQINAQKENARVNKNSPGAKVDPSYQKYLDSKAEQLEKERAQIIERALRERNRGK